MSIEYLLTNPAEWVAWSSYSRRIGRFQNFQEAFEFAGMVLEEL